METKNKNERLTMTIEETCQALGISKMTAYKLARTGAIPVIRLGERRLVVPRAALLKMLESTGGNTAIRKQSESV